VGLVDAPSDLRSGSVWFGEGLFGADTKLDVVRPGSRIVPVNPTGRSWRYEWDWQGRADRGCGPGPATTTVSIQAGDRKLADATFFDQAAVVSTPKEPIAFETPYTIRLSQTDIYGSHVDVAWGFVSLRPDSCD
jgi:hypothetical protein